MRRVLRLEELRHSARYDPAHYPVLHLDDADLVTELPDHGGDFEADVAAADDDDIACGPEVCADPGYVIDATKVVQAVLVAAGYPDVPRTRAGRENQGVVGNAFAGRCGHGLLFAIHCRDPCLQTYSDPRHVIEIGWLEVQAFRGQFPGQKFLRERRPLVRQPGLFADEHDTAVEAFLPERGHDLAGGVTRPGNY